MRMVHKYGGSSVATLDKIEAIARHMFPLAPIPRSRIAWIVTLADKAVASKEVTLAAGDYIALAYRRVFA